MMSSVATKHSVTGSCSPATLFRTGAVQIGGLTRCKVPTKCQRYEMLRWKSSGEDMSRTATCHQWYWSAAFTNCSKKAHITQAIRHDWQ
jgi:hypothetical protein